MIYLQGSHQFQKNSFYHLPDCQIVKVTYYSSVDNEWLQVFLVTVTGIQGKTCFLIYNKRKREMKESMKPTASVCFVYFAGLADVLHCGRLCPLAALICFLIKLQHLKRWGWPITLHNSCMKLVNNECFCPSWRGARGGTALLCAQPCISAKQTLMPQVLLLFSTVLHAWAVERKH